MFTPTFCHLNEVDDIKDVKCLVVWNWNKMKMPILTYCGFNLLILGSTLPRVHDIKGVKSHSLSLSQSLTLSLSCFVCTCVYVWALTHLCQVVNMSPRSSGILNAVWPLRRSSNFKIISFRPEVDIDCTDDARADEQRAHATRNSLSAHASLFSRRGRTWVLLRTVADCCPPPRTCPLYPLLSSSSYYTERSLNQHCSRTFVLWKANTTPSTSCSDYGVYTELCLIPWPSSEHGRLVCNCHRKPLVLGTNVVTCELWSTYCNKSRLVLIHLSIHGNFGVLGRFDASALCKDSRKWGLHLHLFYSKTVALCGVHNTYFFLRLRCNMRHVHT